MSMRALRKLHGDRDDLGQLAAEQFSDEDELETVPLPITKRKGKQFPVNPFDLLNEESNDDVDAINTDEDDRKNSKDKNLAEQQEAKCGGARKKKKKKKKNKNAERPDNVDKVANDQEDDIDASIREVNKMLGEMPTRVLSSNSRGTDFKTLLNIEHKNLNPDNEMRRMFGSRVVQTDPNHDRGNRRQRNRVIRKSTWLVQAKNTWPPMVKTGLTMTLSETTSSGQYFIFEHNKDYQKIQSLFLDSVESINAQNIINMANVYPYHIDTLLQVSEICKMSDDLQMATDFIERAMYVFECAFHPLFSLTQGNCRLDYKKQENRAFYIALFRHLNFIGKKGCNRTALEFCKLILSLDPDGDPLCVLLMIDFYALRSEQYSFIIKMYQEWEAHRNLSQLPNFAFSVPLATFLNAKEDNAQLSAADELLQNALIMFPGLLTPLLDKCGLSPDSKVSSHSFFGPKSQLNQPKALQQLIALYIGRAFTSWKDPDVVVWLERNVKEVLARVDQGDPIVDDFTRKRLSRYQGTPRNIHRHIMISEVPEASAALPPDLANSPVMSYDPLPPPDSVAAYTTSQRPRRIDQNNSSLSMFFQSLLPNFNPQELADEPAPGAVGGQGQGQNFREGVAQVMDAMRDLLNNIRPVPPPLENQGNENDEEMDENQEWD